VKFGEAAFMKSREDAESLGRMMVELATDCGVTTRFVLNDMNQPLGRAVGNWLEVKESVDCLAGRGPADLRKLVLECAAHLLEMTGKVSCFEDGFRRATAVLDAGAAVEKWEAMLGAQGADLAEYRRKLSNPAPAGTRWELRTSCGGMLSRIDAHRIGEVLRRHGAGRLRQSDLIQPDVGIVCVAVAGQTLTQGGLLAEIHAANERHAGEIAAELLGAFVVVPHVQAWNAAGSSDDARG
jgi:pyrimidine-nucleoside phosphorylase